MLPIQRPVALLSRGLAVLMFALTLGWSLATPLSVRAAESTAVVAKDGAKAEGHGAEGHAKVEEHADPPMLPTFVSAIYNIEVGGVKLKKEGFGKFLKTFHKQILSVFITACFVAFVIWASKFRAVMPGRLQIIMEATVGFLHDLVVGILGPQGKQHVPFFGSLFIFVLVFNLCGIVPLLGAPTATIQVTATLAIITYGYVLYHNFKWNGFKGYLYHALGSPKSMTMWFFAPLFFVIHMIEEVARPLSLALRLFGNILGKDILIGVFMMLGIALFGAILKGIGILSDPAYAPIGIPLQFPFYFLAVLLSGVQALVFTLLSTVYLLLAMPHDHDHDGAHHDEGHGHGTVESHHVSAEAVQPAH